MTSPVFLAAVFFGAISIAYACWRPRFALLPSAVLLIVALLQLWGMTEAMPRATMSDIPAALYVEARVALAQGDLSNVAHLSFYSGVNALAERQRNFASPVLLVCLVTMGATQMILCLKVPRPAERAN